MIWSLLEEVIHDLVAQGQTFGPQSSFRGSVCRPPISYLRKSDGATPLIEVVPMGVYYNISKFQPNWINLESQHVKNRIWFTDKPLLSHVLKAATHGGKAWAAVDPCA